MNNCLANARDQLGAAINRRAGRERRVRTAEQAMERGNAVVEEARAKLGQRRADAEEATKRRAGDIKAGRLGALTSVEAEAQSRAQAELRQAIGALALLVQELANARSALIALDIAVSNAVAKVITFEAEQLADELIAHRVRASDLHNVLLGLSYVGHSKTGSFRPWPLTAKLIAALNWSDQQLPGHVNPVKSGTINWTKYRNALVGDADATLDATFPAEDRAFAQAVA